MMKNIVKLIALSVGLGCSLISFASVASACDAQKAEACIARCPKGDVEHHCAAACQQENGCEARPTAKPPK